MEKWTADLIDSQIGKTAIVTGGTDGIGLEVARELARNGAKVIICGDDRIKGESAILNIRSSMHGGHVSYEYIDLADLETVKDFAEKISAEHKHLHMLINNGGIAAVPERLESKQGHELIFAVNFLSHFALTAHLFPLLEKTKGSRVVFQSSIEHREGIIDFFDLNATHFYDPSKAYAQSKLAMIIFARELDRRIRETSLDMKSIPVHPGGARTNIFKKGPSLSNKRMRIHDLMIKASIYAFGQSAAKGALPTLYAATSPEVLSGHYYGPSGFRELKGYPVEVDCAQQAKNLQAGQKLWDVSEDLTGVNFGMRDYSNVLPFHLRSDLHPDIFI